MNTTPSWFLLTSTASLSCTHCLLVIHRLVAAKLLKKICDTQDPLSLGLAALN